MGTHEIAQKIAAGQTLNLEEEQYRQDNNDIIEKELQALKIRTNPWPEIDRNIRFSAMMVQSASSSCDIAKIKTAFDDLKEQIEGIKFRESWQKEAAKQIYTAALLEVGTAFLTCNCQCGVDRWKR